MKVFILSIVIFQRRRAGSRGPSSSTPGCVHVRPPVRVDDGTMDPLPHNHRHRRRRRRRRRQHVKDAAQGVAEGVAEDVAQDLAFGARAARASSPRHHSRRRRLCTARAEMGAQLGSTVAFGSGYGQALPGVPHKAPLCSWHQSGASLRYRPRFTFQMNPVNLNHCARFVFFSRAIDETQSCRFISSG